jgi:hypothetical protein
MPKPRYWKKSPYLERAMGRKHWTVGICGSAAAGIVGGFFFFDILGVFGLSAAITGLVVFIVSSVAIFRFTTLKGAAQ